MIQASIRLNSGGDPGICMTLRALMDRVASRPGCKGCEILQSSDHPERIVYVELWEDWDSLTAHLMSETYAYLLQVLELSTQRPEVEFRELGEARGLEMVEAVRLGPVGQSRIEQASQPKPLLEVV